MAGVWSNILTLDMTIPTNGDLVPGSGTVYIGGPNLPATLPPQYKAALIFYTDAIGLAQGIDYWFIAHYSDASADALQIGFYPTGGPTVVGTLNNLVLNSRQLSILDSFKGDIFLRVLSSDGSGNGQIVVTNQASGGLIQLITRDGTTQFKTIGNNNVIELDTRNDPVIKAWNNPRVDVWQESNTSENIAGLAGTDVKIAWRQTIDRILEMRFVFTFQSAPGSMSWSYTLPGQIPRPDASTMGLFPRGFALAQSPLIVVPISVDNNGFFYAFGPVGSGAGILSGSLIYTVAK